MGKSPSYFYKILLLFLVTVFVTSLVLTLFSYEQFSKSLQEKAYADYQAGLKKNAQTWMDLSSEIGQLNSAITVDPQTEAYFSMRSFDPAQEYNTYLKVKKLFNINPFMESFCLYNPAAQSALYCGTDEIGLDKLWERMQEKNGKVILQSVRTDNGEPLLVFGYPVYVDSFDGPQGAVFLCLRSEEVAAHVMGEVEYGQLVLFEDGTLLLQKGAEEEREAVIDWSLRGSQTSHNQTLSLDNRKYLCSFYKEEELVFVSYVDYGMVMEPLRKQRNIFLLVCLCVMAFSVFLQFIAVKKLYRPIATIREVFEKSRFADGTARGEFDLIRQVYEGAVSQIEELEEKNALYLPRLKADILRELIMGSMAPELAEKRLMEHGWNIPFEGMFLVSVYVDRNLENNLLSNVVQARIRQLMLDEAGELFYVECIPNGSSEVIALINTNGEGQATFEDLVEVLEKIRDLLLRDYDISLTVGLDGVVKNPADCCGIYAKVRQLQKNKFALGENQVIYPARIMELMPEPLTCPDKLMQDILGALNRGEKAVYEEKIQDFLENISRYVYDTASLLFARLYLELAARANQYGGSGKGNVAALEMKGDPATLEEARQLLMNAYEAFENRRLDAEQLKNNKHYKKIKDSQQFILEHYSDCTLGVDMVAEQFGYSTNYFARIFKTITGYYINDYIRQVRIMKAQEFLQNTDMTVNEIAEASGFTTSNYFYAIFKKETGMTPAAFRNGIEWGAEKKGAE